MSETVEDGFEKPTEWKLRGFVEEFSRLHRDMPERSFLFVLGAGASKSSGIQTGAELVDVWLNELFRLEGDADPSTVEEWATAANLQIDGFRYEERATFYPEIYQRRFADDRTAGFAYLESAMQKAEPSFGYSVLARILEESHHKVVVTTNFDNLVADALAIYTDTFPFVCGHELLAEFVRPRPSRPLIVKVHRDLLLNPRNLPEELGELPAKWSAPLEKLFRRHTPIVIGYGGNDGSLMRLLESLEPGTLRGGIIWCYVGDSQPRGRIQKLVARQKGKLVRIPGFDELMLLLNNQLGYDLIDQRIVDKAEERVERYRRQVDSLRRQLSKEGASSEEIVLTRSAFDSTVYRDKEQINWWHYQLKINGTAEPEEKDRLYRRATERFPKSAELAGNFALFLQERQRYDEAESQFRRAMALAPRDALYANNYAYFLAVHRDQPEQAAEMYSTAVALEPQNPQLLAGYAELLITQEKLEAAKSYSLKALEHIGDDDALLAIGLSFNLGIICRLQDQDDSTHLGLIKSYLEHGHKDPSWAFRRILDFARDRLPPADFELYQNLATAIHDPENLRALGDSPRWQDIAPLPPPKTSTSHLHR